LWRILKEERKMAIIPMRLLLEAGVHFGHQTKRWDPRMAPYIFTARNGIYILDLQKTLIQVREAYDLTVKAVAEGGTVLFVGTKKQIAECIKEEADRCGMYYMNSRWLGGTLTNFKTIRTRITRLIELETMEQDGTFEVLPKKEVIKLKLEMEKLNKNLGGIKEMTKLPAVIFLVDSKKEFICTREARRLNIPTIGLIDSNCNPNDVDYVIPGNDDAVRAVKLITAKIADAVMHGKNGEPLEDVELADDIESMADLVKELGEDKIERRQNRPDNRNRPYNNKPRFDNRNDGRPYNDRSRFDNRVPAAKVEVAKVEEVKAEEVKVEEAKVVAPIAETKAETVKAVEVVEATVEVKEKKVSSAKTTVKAKAETKEKVEKESKTEAKKATVKKVAAKTKTKEE